MKFQVQKNILQDALQSALSAVPNKSTLQILNNFSLHLEGNFLEICATDLDLGIRVRVEVQGERDGSVVLNARKISDQIKSLVDPSISLLTFEAKNYLASIQWSEKGRASITGFDASDFPPFPEIDDGETFVMGKTELGFLAEKTLFATSNDTTRMTLNGVFLENKDGKLTMIATDGHRLGQAFIELENFSTKLGVIVPPKAIQYALRSVPNDASIEIRVSSTHILFNSDHVQVISKLIEGPYPKYESVIPRHFERTVQANTADFLNKIRSVISMANARTRQIRLEFEGNLLDLSATDPNVGGDSREEISVTHNGEGSFSIGFNGQYLAEILNMCSSEEVLLKMNNPVGACIIEPVGEGADFSFLLMPLRLIDE